VPGPKLNAHTLAEGRWRAIIDSAVDGIVVIDTRGLIEAFNPAAERMFGFSEAEVIGQNVNILMPAPYRDEHDGYIARYIETGEQRIIGIGREVSGRKQDGTVFPVHLSVGEFIVDNQRHFTGILHDLSARAELEEQLRERTALARLGEMAAVIAHEVKNPLTAVRGAIQVIGGRLPAESKDAPIIREIIARLDALNDLLKDLLLFARTPQPKLAPVRIGEILGMVTDLLSSDPAFARVRIDVTGDAPPVMADAELLKIVFQNLFINAAQAMQGDGHIRASIAVHDRTQHIEIADTGPGIPPDVRRSLFRPFYTTKARGTGLGLSTAKRLIELHQGRIAVACPPTGGTTINISIPTA
jgi:two-component system sensor kinase FixL